MAVPEAAVDKQRDAVAWEKEVRSPRDLTGVYAEAKAEPVEGPPDQQLRLGVPGPD
jgi:hypothetical protein